MAQMVERVTKYKYLGTILDNQLNFNKNTDFIHKRCQPRIFSLQKLRSLNVSAAVFTHFLPVLFSFNILVPVLVWRLECEKQKYPE